MAGYFTDKNKKLHQFAGGDNSTKYCLPVGTIFPSAIPLTDASVHLLDGSTISQTGVYQEFAELLKSLVSAGYDIVYKDDDESTAQQKFDDDIAKSGNCGKFIINGNSTIRLPKITRFIQGLSNMTNIGDSVEAGLPNLTGTAYTVGAGSVGLYSGSSSGVFKAQTSVSGQLQNASGGTTYKELTFDASRSSAVYGKSTTVQPQATSFPYYIVLANGFVNDIKLDIDSVMNELNNNQGIKFAESERLKSLNLFSSTLEQGSIASADGTLSSNDTRVRTANYISLKAGTYTLSNKDKYLIPIVYDINRNHIPYELADGWVTSTTFTFTITNDRLIKFVFRNTDNSAIKPTDVVELMLVEGSAVQSYQPYNGEIVHLKDTVSNRGYMQIAPNQSFSVDGSGTYGVIKLSQGNSITMTTSGRGVLAVRGSIYCKISSGTLWVGLYVDGVNKGDCLGIHTSVMYMPLTWVVSGLSAGEHTIQLKWKGNNSGSTISIPNYAYTNLNLWEY